MIRRPAAGGLEVSGGVARTASLLGLENKVAIVTGAAQNIGRAIALAFGGVGVRVVIADIREAKAEAVARMIERAGGEALAIRTDVRDPEQIRQLAARTAKHFGRIDILVNNAAIVGAAARRPIESTTVEEWDLMQEVSLRSAFLCTQAVLPYLRRRRAGRIINISSVSFWIGASNCAAYVSAKGGLIGLTRSLARDLGPLGINVNAITPGAVLTAQEKDAATPEELDRIVAAQCLKRRIRPVDIAKAAIFLASDLSDAMTGQTINVDGGWSFH